MKEYAKPIDTQTLDNGRIVPSKSWVEKMLRRFLPYKEIGWVDIGEAFFRYQIVKTPGFNIYLHQLDAPQWHPVGCHDHPWWFITFLLKGGYLEYNGKTLKRRFERAQRRVPRALRRVPFSVRSRRKSGLDTPRAAC